MPSGRTHDRITLWSLPWVVAIALGMTRSSRLTLLVAGGFLVGGLILGPDLDIHSRQYQRWGKVRWIWLPYRKMLRHRSFWSHGPLVGTTLRLLYLLGWLMSVGVLGLAIALLGGVVIEGEAVIPVMLQWLQSHGAEGLAIFVGLELGAMSHSASDWMGSTYKRLKKQKSAQKQLSSKKSSSKKSPKTDTTQGQTRRSPTRKTPPKPLSQSPQLFPIPTKPTNKRRVKP